MENKWKTIISIIIYVIAFCSIIPNFIIYQYVHQILIPLSTYILALNFLLYEPRGPNLILMSAYLAYGLGNVLLEFSWGTDHITEFSLISFGIGHLLSIISLYVSKNKFPGKKYSLTSYIIIDLVISALAVIHVFEKPTFWISVIFCYTLSIIACWCYISYTIEQESKLYIYASVGIHLITISQTLLIIDRVYPFLNITILKLCFIMVPYWIGIFIMNGLCWFP